MIDDWADGGFRERTIDTDTLPAGDHEIRVEYYESAGGARVKAIVEVIDPPSCTDPSQPWLARWYGNQTLSGAPATVRCEDVIDDNLRPRGPLGSPSADKSSGRWTWTYTLSAPRILRITGGSDDGIRIYVDGDLVMDDWFDRAFSERTVDTNTLPAGDHQIVVEYYEGAVDVGEGTDPRGPPAGRHGAECDNRHTDGRTGRHDEFGQARPGRRRTTWPSARWTWDPEHSDESVAAGRRDVRPGVRHP